MTDQRYVTHVFSTQRGDSDVTLSVTLPEGEPVATFSDEEGNVYTYEGIALDEDADDY